MNDVIILIISFSTFITAPLVFHWEYQLFLGQSFDPGIIGIAYLGLIMPEFVIVIASLIIFALIKKKIPLKFELGVFLITYLIILLLGMNPIIMHTFGFGI